MSQSTINQISGLWPGKRVTIFHDPITQQNPEGKAVLKKRLFGDEEQQYWRVRFDGDDRDVDRFVVAPPPERITETTTEN